MTLNSQIKRIYSFIDRKKKKNNLIKDKKFFFFLLLYNVPCSLANRTECFVVPWR